MKKNVILVFLFFIFFILFNFNINSKKSHKFENIEVIIPDDYVTLITPSNEEVMRVAKKIQDPVKAYYYVRDFIYFDPSIITNFPETTMRLKAGNCISKAALLVSLYRALGISEGHVRIVVGELYSDRMPIQHAWVDVKYKGRWFQQDPTDLIGVFEFDQFKDRDYFKKFVRVENYCFNDTGFAVVSQRNRFK